MNPQNPKSIILKEGVEAEFCDRHLKLCKKQGNGEEKNVIEIVELNCKRYEFPLRIPYSVTKKIDHDSKDM
jgi:hypothetical protein